MQNRCAETVSSGHRDRNGGRSGPGRGLARHRHVGCPWLNARPRRLSLETGELSSTAEGLDIREHVKRFLCGPIRTPIEQPGVRRHHGILHHESGIVEMSELPVAGTNVELARQIRPDAASAPQLWVIILGLPGFGWRAKAA